MDILDNIRPEARQDIIELEQKIARFKKGEIEEDKFKDTFFKNLKQFDYYSDPIMIWKIIIKKKKLKMAVVI